MDNTLKIWEYLLPTLTSNEELTNIIPVDHINPLGQPEETKYPFIIYRRDSLVPTYTKHLPGVGGWTNNITISVSIYSDNYNETLYAANIIRNAFEGLSGQNEDIKIHAIELANSYETLSNGVFQQNLSFNITAE